MPDASICPECGVPISENALDGLCPQCLLALAAVADKEGDTPAARNLQGSFLGNYEILEIIGEGGMGVVYKARQEELGRTIALKMIRSGPHASDVELQRFRSEAQAAASLRHPNVVAIHEVGEHEGRPFFSMDYVEGENLAEVGSRSPLSTQRASRYVKAIAEAVQYAHENGILHRDLKPANVLIDAEDQPRITDFGLAKQLELDSDLTASGDIMGTPSYTPPEQAEGRRGDMGPASDIYSLGAILYDLLAGRPPFLGETPLDTLRQVTDTEPVSPRLLNAKIPRDLETICLKCLAKEPHQRYDSAREMADELGRFLNGEPIHARPVSSVTRLWRWALRKPSLAGLTGLATLLLVLIGVAAFVFRQDILKTNEFLATVTAEVIHDDLEDLAGVVVEAGQQLEEAPDLDLLIQRGNPKLRRFLETKFEEINQGELKWMGAPPFENWNVFDSEGAMLERSLPDVESDDFSDRDWFNGDSTTGDSGAPAHHVSRAFNSRADGLDKFGISVPIKAGEGEDARTLGVLLATVTTGSTRTISDSQHNAVLIAASDPTDESSSHLILGHPAFESYSEAIGVDALPMKDIPGRSGFYRDPARLEYPRYSGLWLAGAAPIKDTHFFVIVQSRDRVIDALLTAALTVAIASVAILGWWFIRRRRIAPEAANR